MKRHIDISATEIPHSCDRPRPNDVMVEVGNTIRITFPKARSWSSWLGDTGSKLVRRGGLYNRTFEVLEVRRYEDFTQVRVEDILQSGVSPDFDCPISSVINVWARYNHLDKEVGLRWACIVPS